MSIGLLGYSISTILFFFLGTLLLTSWRGRVEGGYLLSAVLITCLWAASAVFLQMDEGPVSTSLYQVMEILRNLVWFAFLFRLLKSLRQAGGSDGGLLHYTPALVLTISLILLFIEFAADAIPIGLHRSDFARLQLVGHLGFGVTGLTLIEQLFRNTRLEKRWAVKYLYFGIGALFVYDFFLYADALLFKQVDAALWEARGFVSTVTVPMIAIAAARNPNWTVRVFVSRRVVFHTTVLFGAGLYLLAMSAVGYYIRLYGGSWGKSAQIAFLFLAVSFLIVILFSSQFRSRVKVFLSKHFFNYKYDYRDEWLRIIQTFSGGEPGLDIKERVIKAIADLVDSGGGVLWMRDDSGKYLCTSQWQLPMCDTEVPADSSIIRFLKEKEWIIDVEELAYSPGLYDELELPQGFEQIHNAWLIIPILHHGDLIGFMVLVEPRAPRQINWEDRDLLKAAAQQAGSYLALMKTSEDLTHANQFEAFNRLSAFVVHDLKNLLAQLELVVKNAERHKNNPAFMEDTIMTVENAAKKMARLLAQLRKGRFEERASQRFFVSEAVAQAVNQHLGFEPKPELIIHSEDLQMVADKDRFTAVVGHMIKNAQEATRGDGYVRVTLDASQHRAVIMIEDNGTGMDAKFLRERLFQPFETTKGNAGMGVGVYESREFIRSLGGEIDVTSEVGKGTKFVLNVPVKEPAPDTGLGNLLQQGEPMH